MLKLQLSARRGRMGQALVEAIQQSNETELVAQDADNFDLLIDFSTPQGTQQALERCLLLGKPMVIGTTGFDENIHTSIREAAQTIAIVLAPNTSVGVNVMFKLAQLAATALGETTDIEILETHHRHKVDAPSGTALRIGEIIAETFGRSLSSDETDQNMHAPAEREQGRIGFQSVRAGDVVGEHTVQFAGEGERLEITHKASSRRNYAEGALRAARWLGDKESGLYDMQDVLGLNA